MTRGVFIISDFINKSQQILVFLVVSVLDDLVIYGNLRLRYTVGYDSGKKS